MKIREPLKNFSGLLLVGVFLQPQLSQSAPTAQGRMYCLSVKLDEGMNRYGDTLNVNSTGAPEAAGELIPWQIFPEVFPHTESYSSWLIIYEDFWNELYNGTLNLNLPPLSDNNGNHYPDFFEVSRSIVGATSSGSFSLSGWGSGTVSATWNRAAGSRAGTCTLNLGSYWESFNNTFEILEYTGPLSYTPGSNTVSGSVNFTKTGEAAKTLAGPVQFPKVAGNKYNELDLQATTWANEVPQTLNVLAHRFQRETGWPQNYYGYLEFDDDANPGSLYPWGTWVLSITDTNDTNGNGIPDFSDDPAAALPRAPSLGLALGTTNVLMTIGGDVGHIHEVLGANTLTSTWQVVTSLNLTLDPQVISLPRPAAAKYWRARAQ